MTTNFSDVRQCVARTWFAAALLAGAVLAGCGDASASGPGKVVSKDRVETAAKMFQERCKSAGEKIHKTVQGVEGIFLINLRPEEPNFDQQFALDDPYGADFRGEAYITSFLRGFYATNFRRSADVESHTAYGFVEAIDPADGKRYRYTGRIEVPGLTNPKCPRPLPPAKCLAEELLVDAVVRIGTGSLSTVARQSEPERTGEY